ncbi:type I pantothenate kinase, partial [Vibrio parahaemolyticus]|nr:type I pantothenate kinase [Vibrio parahaemolyticus]
QLSVDDAKKKAKQIWHDINGLNLELNILPTRERAHLILHKGVNHLVDKVSLRK